MTDPLEIPGQRERLQRLANEAGGWGVLIYMERSGDVAFLAPIYPELRGVEIVSAIPQPGGKDYDLWKNGQPLKFNQTLAQVGRFLKKYAKSDEELKANAEDWVKATFRYYGITPKPTHRSPASRQ